MLDAEAGRAATVLCRVDTYGKDVSFRQLVFSVVEEVDPRLKLKVRLG